MKKYKLKRWVRKALVIIGIIIVVVLAAIILDKQYKGAVEDCVAGGNTRVFCENTLR